MKNKVHCFAISCTKCGTVLPLEMYNTLAPEPCPSCGVKTHTAVFPAVRRSPKKGQLGDNMLDDGSEAGCFYHEAKKAVVACESCGRFLCALCDIELDNKHLCSACIQSGKKKGTLKKLGNKRTLYDELTLGLAIIPIIFVWPTIITAPITIIIAIRFWNAPSSVIPRTKARFIIAILLATLQILGWSIALILILKDL